MTQPVVVTLPAAPVKGPSVMDVQDAIYAWASAAAGTGVTVAWADQDGTKPAKPFVLLSLYGPAQITGRAWPSQNGEAITATHRYTVNVQAFTNPPVKGTLALAEVVDASQLASDLALSLDDTYLAEALAAAGVGVGPIHPPQDLSQALDTKTERRVSFDWEANVLGTLVQSKNYSIQNVTAPGGALNP